MEGLDESQYRLEKIHKFQNIDNNVKNIFLR